MNGTGNSDIDRIDAEFQVLPIDMIDDNPDNDKIYNMDKIAVLARIIEQDGFNSAVEVFQKEDGRYEIISGHRRVTALRRLDRKLVPCMVKEKPKDSVEKDRRLINSNLANRTFRPLDIARSIEHYINRVIKPRAEAEGDKNPKIIEEVCEHFGLGRTAVYNYRSILKVIPELQELANDPQFPYKAFINAKNLTEDQQMRLYERVKSYGSRLKDSDGNPLDVSHAFVDMEMGKIVMEDEARARREEKARREALEKEERLRREAEEAKPAGEPEAVKGQEAAEIQPPGEAGGGKDAPKAGKGAPKASEEVSFEPDNFEAISSFSVDEIEERAAGDGFWKKSRVDKIVEGKQGGFRAFGAPGGSGKAKDHAMPYVAPPIRAPRLSAEDLYNESIKVMGDEELVETLEMCLDKLAKRADYIRADESLYASVLRCSIKMGKIAEGIAL